MKDTLARTRTHVCSAKSQIFATVATASTGTAGALDIANMSRQTRQKSEIFAPASHKRVILALHARCVRDFLQPSAQQAD